MPAFHFTATLYGAHSAVISKAAHQTNMVQRLLAEHLDARDGFHHAPPEGS